MGSSQSATITFRMVACDIEEKIKILTAENLNLNGYFYSFVVLNHKLAISHIEMMQDYSNIWINLTRQENNYWFFLHGTCINMH
jgi:expansin (peptidoglycan-binding protein)